MVFSLDMKSSVPIYVQLRNQIVLGIARGELKAGENLPTVRQLASDTGINAMTVNKTYQILKSEGFIEIDRRHGAAVCQTNVFRDDCREKLEGELAILLAEASVKGMEEEEFIALCRKLFASLKNGESREEETVWNGSW